MVFKKIDVKKLGHKKISVKNGLKKVGRLKQCVYNSFVLHVVNNSRKSKKFVQRKFEFSAFKLFLDAVSQGTTFW